MQLKVVITNVLCALQKEKKAAWGVVEIGGENV